MKVRFVYETSPFLLKYKIKSPYCTSKINLTNICNQILY